MVFGATPVFELGKVALEEQDLVLSRELDTSKSAFLQEIVRHNTHFGRVRRVTLHAEVVQKVACTKVRRRLRDELGTLHRLPVPQGCLVQCDAKTVCFARCRVFVAGVDREVLGCRARAVDVLYEYGSKMNRVAKIKKTNPLIFANLVRPRPSIERRRCRVSVERARPDCGAGKRKLSQRGNGSERGDAGHGDQRRAWSSSSREGHCSREGALYVSPGCRNDVCQWPQPVTWTPSRLICSWDNCRVEV